MTATMTRYIQLGRETTAGTQRAATTIWSGMANSIEDLRVINYVTEHRGRISPSLKPYSPKLEAGLSIPATEATFEQVQHVFEAGIKAVTAAADGSGSGKVYAYPLPTTSTVPAAKTYTLEAGDAQQCHYMAYGHVTDFTLSGASGEALKVASTWRGREKLTMTKTAGLAVPTVNEVIQFGNGKIYLDTPTTAFGTTQKTSTLVGFTLKVTTGLQAKWMADGALTFSAVFNDPPGATLDVSFEYDASAVAEEAAYRAQTTRYLRLKFDGTTLTTAGTTYSKKALVIDVAGVWDKFPPLGDKDANDIITGTLRVLDNETNFCTLTVVNELSSVP